MWGGVPTGDSKQKLLEQAKAERKAREEKRKQEEQDEKGVRAAKNIQRVARGFLGRCRGKRELREGFDKWVASVEGRHTQIVASTLYVEAQRLLYFFNQTKDGHRLASLGRVLLGSMESSDPKMQYVSLAAIRHADWLHQVKRLVILSLRQASYALTTDTHKDTPWADLPTISRDVLGLFRLALTFTDCSAWRIVRTAPNDIVRKTFTRLCVSVLSAVVQQGMYLCLGTYLSSSLAVLRPSPDKLAVAAAVTLAVRPLLSTPGSDVDTLFAVHILSVPALITRLNAFTPDVAAMLLKVGIWRKTLGVLYPAQSVKVVFNALEGNYALCLLGNLVELTGMHLNEHQKTVSALVGDKKTEAEMQWNSMLEMYVPCLSSLLSHCQSYVAKKAQSKGPNTNFHPIVGWYQGKVPQSLQDVLSVVQAQLEHLWGPQHIKIYFRDLDSCIVDIAQTPSSKDSKRKSVTSKAVDLRVSLRLRDSCQLLNTMRNTLPREKNLILNRVSYYPDLLPRLLILLSTVGPREPFEIFLSATADPEKEPYIHMLLLFCDCCTNLLVVLDDVEMYDKQTPLTLVNFCTLVKFLNRFVFRLLWQDLADPNKEKSPLSQSLLSSSHGLLMMLRDRDSRRSFTNPQDWTLPSDYITQRNLNQALNEGKARGQALLSHLPHIVPFRRRVQLFREYVARDRLALGIGPDSVPRYITVQRSRVLEDGYRQLSAMTPTALKGTIRVKFVNAQGLDEIGIDQDGVFKEFLEETIRQAFNPAFGLFATTSDQQLYPSVTSHVHDNHLSLFDFVGRMLGKAMYEGMIEDIPFAHFFLSKVLGRYNYYDELPSLDPELYKNLTFLKNYDGNVEDLGLTFSVDEDRFGKVETVDLRPGGSAMPVTNENRILYIYLMADYRLNRQLGKQSRAFIQGFTSIINKTWLRFFNATELQRLISGDNVALDLEDLKRNCVCHGYSSGHRTIRYLWQVLEEFTPEQQRLFLKFVTSCSKPPILGFSALEPKFSIRFVESGEEDEGPSGNAIVNILTFGAFGTDTNRLPTASTCFNLLKLPAYKKKSTLREKLLYAITSKAGFELA